MNPQKPNTPAPDATPGTAAAPAAGTPLTMDQMERILRDVSLGVDPPDNETPEAAAWRAKMEQQVEQHRDQGMMNDIPFNP